MLLQYLKSIPCPRGALLRAGAKGMNSQEIGRKKKKNKQTSAKGMNSQEIGRKIRRNYKKKCKMARKMGK